MRDIWKYLVSSNVTDNAWYNYVYNISSYGKINTQLLVLYARNEKKTGILIIKRYKIKLDICKYLRWQILYALRNFL